MAFILKDRVRESTTTTGTGPLVLAGAPGGYQTFSAVMAITDTCWYAIILPGSAWETGIGTYSGVNELTRTTILESSNAGSVVSFGAGTKDVVICAPASKSNVMNNTFPAGTLMLFQQTTAPTYWTKQVTHNDKALRVVSGTASSGGSNSFSSTLNGVTTASSTTLSLAQTPAHSHTYTGATQTKQTGLESNDAMAAGGSLSTGSQGGGGSHNHTVTLAIQYVDLIIAVKD